MKKYPYRRTFLWGENRKRIEVYANTEKELEKKILDKKAELMAQDMTGRKPITRKMLVRDYVEQWLDLKEPTISGSYYAGICYTLNNHILPEIGYYRLDQIRNIHLQKLLNERNHMSKSALSKIRALLKELFRSMMMQGLLNEDPSAFLTVPKSTAEEHPHKQLSVYEITMVMKTAENHRFGLFVKLCLLCGCRPQEAGALTWNCVDLEKNTIRIDKALKRKDPKGIGPTKSKAGKRSIPIPAMLKEDLAKEKKEAADPFGYVCTNTRGGRLTDTSIRRGFDSFKKDMEIAAGAETYKGRIIGPKRFDSITLYDLRHTYASNLAASGVNITVSRDLMGHSDAALTARVYTHTSEETSQEAVKMVEKHLKKQGIG